jgi:hypothetical protein
MSGCAFPKSWTTVGVVLGISLSCASFSSHARAAPADAETRSVARELALRGAEAFERQDFAAALDSFTRANALYRAPSISVMRARSLARLGRLVEALDAYEETQRMALADDAPTAFKDAVVDAKREGEEVRARIPHLAIRVRDAHGIPAGLEVVLDGKPVPAALLDVERPVDPGVHQVSVTAPPHAPVTRTAKAAEGDHVALAVTLDDAEGPPRVTAASDADTNADQSSAGSRRFWGWTAVGVGVVGIGVSAVTGAIALDKKSSLDTACRPGCPPGSGANIDSFRQNRTLSYVSLAVGAVSLGVGSYVLLSGHADSAHVAAGIGPGSATIVGVF